MRAVIDTLTWVEGFLSANKPNSPGYALIEAVRQERFTAYVSRTTLVELVEVLMRPKFRKYNIDPQDVLEFAALLANRANVVDITGKNMGCQDPDDDMVIETAEKARVHFLATRDLQIRDAKIVEYLEKTGIRVVLPAEFLEELRRLAPYSSPLAGERYYCKGSGSIAAQRTRTSSREAVCGPLAAIKRFSGTPPRTWARTARDLSV